ncbi:tryptophanyl-tRNA synthetase [Wilcoxina mikolae CBS 423.85]|nr:tryptophanyl-tRNA synthetase [Wilcoxina mikolae CBS 423.85]
MSQLPRHLQRRLSAPRRFNSTEAAPSKVVFSGIQPTGIPHLGNYLGALRQWVDIQSSAPSSAKLIFSIVDLHAITQRQDAETLRRCKKEMLATILAIGIDPKRSILFEQSKVMQHAELMWILSCGASTGYLSRMTQWKSKLGVRVDANPFEGKSTAKLKLGLFSYPVLQAADILVHRATEVPVGEDQAQHLEFTREVAATFHSSYGEVFPLPKTVLSPARRVMSIRDPLVKMSKSDPQPHSRILLTDTPEEISSKLKKAVTDSIGGVSFDPKNRPGVSNLVQIYAHMQRRDDFESVATEFEGCNMKALKDRVTECVIEGLKPVREEYERIMKEGDGYLEQVAEDGAMRARESAEETMQLVRGAMGLA